jgi:hypothetical protein
MASAKQKSALPTRKLSIGASITGVFGVWAGPVVQEVWPQLVWPVLAGESVTNAVAALTAAMAGVVVAWFVPDAPNQVAT